MKEKFFTGALALSMLLASSSAGFAAVPDNVATEPTDANAAAINLAFRVDEQSLPYHVYNAESYAQDLEDAKQQLQTQVQHQEITAQDAAKILDDMRQTLQQLKNGTLMLYQFETIDENGEPISVFASIDKETISCSDFNQANGCTMQFKDAVVSTTDANGTLTTNATCSTAIAVTSK